jgi:hypothetical protein
MSGALATCEIVLDPPAHEMSQEEILKQVGHISTQIANVAFAENGRLLRFDAPQTDASRLQQQAASIAKRVERSLRSLQRKVVFQTRNVDRPTFLGDGNAPGIQFLGLGQVALSGVPLRLFNYFDRAFAAIGDVWSAAPLRVPTLIPVETLAKCDYFRSFPHIVTFATHLAERHETISDFRARHQESSGLDPNALADMMVPEAGLSPAVCYHAYSLNAGTVVPAGGISYAMAGKCFRYEASNLRDLRRLWDFTMREIVFIGAREDLLARRERATGLVADFLDSHELAGDIRTASDPFFVAPDAVAKTYFQLSSDTKYEISLVLPGAQRLAVGSLNYHSDFFGRAFDVRVEGADYMHSVCVAFGLERWVYAFLCQHGNDPRRWPSIVRDAPEFK